MVLSVDPILPPPSADAAQHSHKVAEQIARTIANEDDWIPFSRYMELALYATGLGYYAAGARKFGAEGDFVTAPEVSPAFGKCLAHQARQVLRQTGGQILELGPGVRHARGRYLRRAEGAGRAAGQVPDARSEPGPARPAAPQALRAFPQDFERFVWLDKLPDKVRGVVSRTRSSTSCLSAWFTATRAAKSSKAASGDRGGLRLGRPADARRRPQAPRACSAAAGSLLVHHRSESRRRRARADDRAQPRRGCRVLHRLRLPGTRVLPPAALDGDAALPLPHRFHGDPFFMPGLQDITAHVDFTAMGRAAESADAEILGFTTQAHFLISCGLANIVSMNDPRMTLSRLKGTSAVFRLINPAEMGELFKVLAIGKGFTEPLLGFQSARPLSL
jgi:hypothetical protein